MLRIYQLIGLCINSISQNIYSVGANLFNWRQHKNQIEFHEGWRNLYSKDQIIPGKKYCKIKIKSRRRQTLPPLLSVLSHPGFVEPRRTWHVICWKMSNSNGHPRSWFRGFRALVHKDSENSAAKCFSNLFTRFAFCRIILPFCLDRSLPPPPPTRFVEGRSICAGIFPGIQNTLQRKTCSLAFGSD